MKLKWMILGYFLLNLAFFPLKAQDEYFLRNLLDREKPQDSSSRERGRDDSKFQTRTGRYLFDLNDDGKKESFYFSKRDGGNWLFIYDNENREIFSYFFESHGPWSWAYKLEARYLSAQHRIFLIYFYEGRTDYTKFQSTARIYFLTLDRSQLGSLKMTKGPYLWEEYEDKLGHYHHRTQFLSLADLDGNGMREVIVKYGLISRVYRYREGGKWLSLTSQGSSSSSSF